VKLHNPELATITGDLLGERERHKRLARSRRAVEHDLALLKQKIECLLQPFARDKDPILDLNT
jgi:hypothetical protein